jgi:hypothetical protein
MKTHLKYMLSTNPERSFTSKPINMIQVLNMLNSIAENIQECELEGNGTTDMPYTMNSIKSWKAAANLKSPSLSYYQIGNMLLEKNPNNGCYANYIYAIDQFRAICKKSQQTPLGKYPYFFNRNPTPKNPVYKMKAEDLTRYGNDIQLVKIARQLMKGEQVNKDYPDELPNTIATLFISEVSRSAMMLPIGLMLLDLIEAGIKYGKEGKKSYTWSNILFNDSRDQLTNPDILGLGGKHPMTCTGSVKMAKKAFDGYSIVNLRAISILTAWLHAYIQQYHANIWETSVCVSEMNTFKKRELKYTTFTGFKKQQLNSKSFINNDFCDQVIIPAINKRITNLNCLITTPNIKIDYQI